MLTQSNNSKRNRVLIGEWQCPDELFQELDNEFHFTLDACAQPFSAKCKKFFTPKDDGLAQNWKGHTVWCFPPSGVCQLRDWVRKAAHEAKKANTTVVMLLPVSTDARWFHEHILHANGVTLRFLPARVHYENLMLPTWAKEGTAQPQKKGSMRPSMVVIFTGGKKKFQVQ